MTLLSAVLEEADKATSEEFTKKRNSLTTKLKDLTEKIKMLSWCLQENIIDNYLNFTPTKSLEQISYKTRKTNIISEYEQIISDLKSLQESCEVDMEFQKTSDKLTKSFDFLQALCVAVESKRELEQINHEFTRYNYCKAMLSVSDLQKRLKNLKFEGDIAKAVANIVMQAEAQHSLYSANVSAEWEDIFSWSEKKGVFHLTFSLSVQQSDPIVIQNILKTLHATKKLNFELGLFSNFFISKLLCNIIRYNCDIFTEDVIAPDHTIVFNIKIDLKDSTRPTYQTVFNNLMAVFDFLQSTLGSRLDSDKTFIEVFSLSVCDKFFNIIIEDCIRNNLPSCDSTYQNYKNLVEELDSFNKFLIELKFVTAEGSPLNKYIIDTECVLYNKKCDKMLSDIKNLLNESLSYGTVCVGAIMPHEEDSVLDVTDKGAQWDFNKPLFLPRCVISQNVKKILTIIVEHLEESVKLPKQYGKQLTAYIRNIAVMYQCIVPKKYKVNLEYCPLDIALFFNNCFYLAHGLLGPPWKSILPTIFAERLTAAFLDCIQDLRVLGLEKISLYLQNQKNTIMRSILPDELPPWTHDTFDQFDGAINQAITLMNDLKHNWFEILPSRMYVLSLCTLIQALCESLLQRILSEKKPVDEDLVFMIAVRLEEVQKEIIALFKEPIDFDKKIDVWCKFTKMPQLLKAQLLELSRLWNESKELPESYSCDEIRQIIKMRFPDDKYRLKILMEIQ